MLYAALNRALNQAGRIGVASVRTVWGEAGKNASGRTIQSLEYETMVSIATADLASGTFSFEGSVTLKGSDVLQYVNDGRQPGSMPPVDPIEDWAAIRNVQGRDARGRFTTRRSTAWAIAVAIKRDGIEPVPIFRPAADLASERVRAFMSRAFAQDASNILARQAQQLVRGGVIEL